MVCTRRLVRLVGVGVVAGLTLGGCNSGFSPAGNGFSNDRFSYVSTSWSPKTVELMDTRSGQTLWSVDIPVGKKLTVKFEEAHDLSDAQYPDRMTWVVQRSDGTSWKGKQDMLVPNATSRVLQMTLRTAPEMPDQTAASPEPPALEPEVETEPAGDGEG